MIISTKKLAILTSLSFGIFSHAFAYCDSIDSTFLNMNLQVLKNLKNDMEKFHNDDMAKKSDTLTILHNDMVQINNHLMNMNMLLSRVLDNQREGLQVKNNSVALLDVNNKNEDKKSLKKLEEATVK